MYTYSLDHLGSTNELRDSTGLAAESYKYDEFGELLVKPSDNSIIQTHLTYTGHEYDRESSLYYAKARYLDAGLGRFISEDTYEGELGNPLSLNLYTYVHNNPLKYVDPSGHCGVLPNDTVYNCNEHDTTLLKMKINYANNVGNPGMQNFISNTASQYRQNNSGWTVKANESLDNYRLEWAYWEEFEFGGATEVGFWEDPLWYFVGVGGIAKQGLKSVITKQTAKNATKATSGKILWGTWDDYAKVVVNEQDYAVVGQRLYSKHAVDRIQPSGSSYRNGSKIISASGGGDYGRGVPPSYIEYVLSSVSGVKQANGNYSYISGTLQVIINDFGAVVTVITK